MKRGLNRLSEAHIKTMLMEDSGQDPGDSKGKTLVGNGLFIPMATSPKLKTDLPLLEVTITDGPTAGQ